MVRLSNTPKKMKPAKPTILVGLDDKLLVMTQRGGKLKAHMVRGTKGFIDNSFLIVESREDLMFVKDEYKFFQDEIHALELAHRAAIREKTKEFFRVLEHSRVYRPHRVKIKWEA